MYMVVLQLKLDIFYPQGKQKWFQKLGDPEIGREGVRGGGGGGRYNNNAMFDLVK